MNPLIITFNSTGIAQCLYSELIDLSVLGPLALTRISTVEFNPQQQHWEVRQPDGMLLFSHKSRALCLAWEHQHFSGAESA